jgi:uncharacterized protein YeaO (DUF488 family)
MERGVIRIKRVYEPASSSDGARFLVERLWPRGMKKESLKMDGWQRDVAPSPELRQWYGHDPAKWPEFKRRYLRELGACGDACRPLLDAARRGPVTLLYSARDIEHNSAMVLKAFLETRIATGAVQRRSRKGGRKTAREV